MSKFVQILVFQVKNRQKFGFEIKIYPNLRVRPKFIKVFCCLRSKLVEILFFRSKIVKILGLGQSFSIFGLFKVKTCQNIGFFRSKV